jgi:CheY-like chemotaxis protein
VAPHRSAPSSKEFHGQGTILVVEDEADIRMAVSTILEHAGFSVLQACDGREGLERFKLHGGEIRLVLLDLTMPHMDGAECLKALRTLDPSVPVLLSSGFSEHESTDALLSLGLAGFLQKPYKASTLLAKLQKILG